MRDQSVKNVILVISDTLRKDCVGTYGSPPWGPVFTPHIDSLARESLVFTRAYPESLPTLPARRALYTGMRTYPFHNGDFRLKGDFVPAPGWGPIPEEQHTLAEILGKAGWRTGLISDLYHQFKPSKNYWRGFDQWSFVRGQEADPARSGPVPTKAEIDHWCPPELGVPEPERTDLVRRCLANMHDRKEEQDWTTAKVFQEASRWLDQNMDADHMFLIVECFDPHEPWFVPESYRRLYSTADGPEQVFSPYAEVPELPAPLLERTRANYSGLVTMVDRWIGHFTDAIRDLGLLDQTLIVLTSDHGHSLGEAGYIGKRGYPSGPEVVDVPLLIRHPDGSGAGGSADFIVQHHDIPAFILDIVGVQPPVPIDGLSFRSAAYHGGTPQRSHATIGWGSFFTVIRDPYWFNGKVNGDGLLLHRLDPGSVPSPDNLVIDPDIAAELYSIASGDAASDFPAYLLRLADEAADAPGCSSLAQRPQLVSHLERESS